MSSDGVSIVNIWMWLVIVSGAWHAVSSLLIVLMAKMSLPLLQ
jgi:hypothetical protein